MSTVVTYSERVNTQVVQVLMKEEVPVLISPPSTRGTPSHNVVVADSEDDGQAHSDSISVLVVVLEIV